MKKYESYPVTLKVISYWKYGQCWICRRLDTNEIVNVDFIADASFHNEYKDLKGEDFEKYCESFVGKEIKCEYLTTHIYFSVNSIK